MLDVNSGQNGAIGIVQNLGGYRSEDEPPKLPVPMCRHHNQLYLFGMRQIDDGVRHISFEQHAPDRHIPELIGLKRFEVSTALLTALFEPSGFSAASYQILQLEYMSEDEFGAKPARQHFGIMGGFRGSFGVIDGQKYFR